MLVHTIKIHNRKHKNIQLQYSILAEYTEFQWAGYSDCLRARRFGDRIPVGARFSAPVQTGPEAHPASCTMGTGSFQGVKCGRGVTLTPHPLLVSRLKIV
jgi:hypothetical protein